MICLVIGEMIVITEKLGASTCLLLASELLVGDVCRQVGVQHSAKGQAIIPAATEVCDINVLREELEINYNVLRRRVSILYSDDFSLTKLSLL